MPSCEKYEDLLQQYLDKALDSAQTAVLMSHIEVCARCRLDYKLYGKLVLGLEQMEELAPPSRLTCDVMSRLDREQVGFAPAAFAARRLPAGPWAWGLSTAFAVAIALAFLVLPPSTPTGTPAPTMEPTVVAPKVAQAPQVPVEFPTAASAADSRIVLQPNSGPVQVQRSNTTKWELASAKTAVGYGDKIRTLAESSAVIEYTQDKTYLKLKPNSLVQILTNAVRVFHGDTWIRVDKIGSRFQAETPNAVASVRGTVYSAEVHYPERIARFYNEGDLDEGRILQKFMQEYKKNLTDSRMNGLMPMFAYPMHATPVSLVVQVNMLLDTVNATRECHTNVQVFQSKVDVASIDPATNRELAHTLVREGYQTSVQNMQLAKLTTLREDDFVKWNQPINQQLLERVRAESVASDFGTAGAAQPVAPPTPAAQPAQQPFGASAADGPTSVAGDRSDPGFGGVERRD